IPVTRLQAIQERLHLVAVIGHFVTILATSAEGSPTLKSRRRAPLRRPLSNFDAPGPSSRQAFRHRVGFPNPARGGRRTDGPKMATDQAARTPPVAPGRPEC